MQKLKLADVEQIVRLLSEAADPTVEIALPERKRILLEGVARMIDSDIWLWSTFAVNPEVRGDAMTMCMIEGGWKNEDERAAFYRTQTDRTVGNALQGGFTDIAQRRLPDEINA